VSLKRLIWGWRSREKYHLTWESHHVIYHIISSISLGISLHIILCDCHIRCSVLIFLPKVKDIANEIWLWIDGDWRKIDMLKCICFYLWNSFIQLFVFQINSKSFLYYTLELFRRWLLANLQAYKILDGCSKGYTRHVYS